MHTKVFRVFLILGLAQSSFGNGTGAKIDSHFAVDPDELQLREIAENLKRMSGAVMGLTEYVMEIRQELRTIRADISPSNLTAKMRPDSYFSRPIRDPEEVRRQSLELADKVERLLAMDQSPEVDLAKEELRRTVEKNFLRMLAAILVTGPAHTQERSDDIFKLMRSVLNGELDFTPVVQRLPLILRDSETNQFVNLLITLRESERGNSFGLGLINSVEGSAKVSNDRDRQILPSFPSTSQLLGRLPNPGQLLSGYRPNNNNNNINTNNNNLVSSSQSVVTTGQNGQQVVSSPAAQLQQQQQLQLQQQIIANQNQNLQNVNNNNNVNNQQTQAPQRNQLPTINSILDAMTQANQLVNQIPSLVEGLQTIVETIEGLFG